MNNINKKKILNWLYQPNNLLQWTPRPLFLAGLYLALGILMSGVSRGLFFGYSIFYIQHNALKMQERKILKRAGSMALHEMILRFPGYTLLHHRDRAERN